MRVQLIKFLVGIVFVLFAQSLRLSGADRRFKAFVLTAGTMSDEVDFKTGAYKEFREKIGPEKFDASFLVEQLKLKPVPANVIAGVPDLYQPPRQN